MIIKTCPNCGLPDDQVCDECSWEVDRENWENDVEITVPDTSTCMCCDSWFCEFKTKNPNL